MTNFIQIIPVKCDCCGKMTDSFSDKSEWFGKYLKPDEDKICSKCIRDRAGYAQEFLEKIGVLPEAMDKTRQESQHTLVHTVTK